MVFAELKELSGGNRIKIRSSKMEALESLLVERNHPLINLGLACYGTNKRVFTALYKHSLEPARDTADGMYKRNLRIGCLSNQTIAAANLIYDFPRDLLGEARFCAFCPKQTSLKSRRWCLTPPFRTSCSKKFSQSRE